MVMYIDFIFILNFVIDAAVLYVVAWTLKLQVKRRRIAASAAIGASYVILIFFPEVSVLFTFICKVIISLLMVWTAFGFHSMQFYLRSVAAFYLVNFIAAGGIYGVHHSLRSSSEVVNGILFTQSGGTGANIGLFFLLLVFAAILLFYRKTFRLLTRTKQLQQYICEVHIHINANRKVCQGLIDTGNRLVDPLTRSPVMIMEVQQWEHLLPASLLECIRSSDTVNLHNYLNEDTADWNDRFRIVPYRSVNRDSQFMLAVKPDKVVVCHQTSRIETHKVLIGLEGGKLSSDGTYSAIIHPQLVEPAH